MKKLRHLITALLLTSALASADLVIEQKMESPFMNGNMVMKIKGDRARMDVPSPVGQTTVLMDMKAGEMTTLMHAQKMAMKMNMSQAKAAAEQQKKATGLDVQKMSPKATGMKEKVGEWDCEIYEAEMGGGMTSKMWVAKDYPNYKPIMEQLSRINAAASAGMGMDPSKFDLGGMPVKTEVNTPAGKVTTTLLSVKTDGVADTEFEVPAGYNLTEMPKLK